MEEGFGQLIEQFFSSTWGSAVIWFGGLWAVMQFIRKVSKDFDTDLAPEKRQFLAEKLSGSEKWSSGSWVIDFTEVFDRFFGKKYFRWRCIYRSVLISICTYVVLLTLLLFEISIYSVVGTVLFSISMNAFADYWSLLETRILLNLRLPILAKILLDIVLTILITLCWFTFVIWVMTTEYTEGLFAWVKEFWLFVTEDFWDSLWLDWLSIVGRGGIIAEETPEYTNLLRIVVATSFTTSIWLWLHGLAQLAIRCSSGSAFLMSWLNIKEKPIRAVGTTINAFVLIIGIALFPIFAIVR